MKYCEECGAQLEDDMRFCDECGTPVSDYEEAQEVKETGAQVQSVAEQKVTEPQITTKNIANTQSPGAMQSEEPRPTLRNTGKKAPKKGGLIAAVVGVLLVAAVVIGIVFLGKGDEGKNPEPENKAQETVRQDGEEQETVKQDNDTPKDSGQKEQTETKVTEAVVADKKEESDVKEDAYPLLEEFIDVVCSYSDPPPFEGDLLDAYFKLEYDSWVSGEGYTNIVIGEDGHLINTDEYSYGDPLTGDNIFRDVTYGAYTIVGNVGDLEYGFRVKKEKSYYGVDFVYVMNGTQYFASLEYSRDGVYMDEGNVASGIVDNTGEWVQITFVPYYDGECWFELVAGDNGSTSVIVDEILPAECVSLMTFDNYQEYYTFLWN